MLVVVFQLGVELGGEELFRQGLHDGQVQDLVGRGPVARRDLQHELDDGCHFLAEVVRNTGKLALDDLLVEALHVIGTERRHESAHLVEDTAEGPDVALAVVRLVAPYLRTRVVRRPRLRIAQAFFYDFGDVKIAELGLHVLEQEEISALHVAVQDVPHVEGLESAHDLDEHVPDFLLLDVGLTLLIVADFLEDVTVVGILHDEAEGGGRLVDEGVPIGNHVGVVD